MQLPEAVKELINQRVLYLMRMIDYWDERAEKANFEAFLLGNLLEGGVVTDPDAVKQKEYVLERRADLAKAAESRQERASKELHELLKFTREYDRIGEI